MSDPDRSEDGDESDADPFGEEVFDDEPSGEDDGPFEPSDADEVDDPFAALDEGVGRSASPADGTDPEASAGSDPEPGAPADDPFAEIDADAGGAAGDEDPFESMESGDVGEEDVWAALDEGTSIGTDATEFGAESVDGEGAGDTATDPEPGADAAAAERVVDKRSYCQQCPHFTAPPETACTHEGTEIVESVDFSRFRVRNCPMVDAADPAFDGE
jgi:hypothetical protein